MPLMSVLGTRMMASEDINPRSAFINGEVGNIFDNSRLDLMFQDVAGTTPATLNGPVGLQLDLSKGLALGPELVTNGGFDSDTAWGKGAGVTISNGVAVINTSSTVINVLLQSNICTLGTFYKIQVTITGYVSGSVHIRYPYDVSRHITANGTHTFIVVAMNEPFLLIQTGETGAVLNIDNISVKSIAGNHRYQPTSTKRLTLSARVNKQVSTENFSTASWTRSGTALSTLSTLYGVATLMLDNSNNLEHYVEGLSDSLPTTANVAYTFSVNVKPYNAPNFSIAVILIGHTTPVSIARFTVSGDVPVFASYGSGHCYTGLPVITLLGDGCYNIKLTYTTPANLTSHRVRLYQYLAQQVWIGTGVGTYFWNVDIRESDLATGLLPAYQRVTTATNYDTVGFPYYLHQNGVADAHFITSAINATAFDKVTVWCGIRKLNDAATGAVMEFGTSHGSCAIFSPLGADTNCTFRVQGTVRREASAVITAPSTNTLIGIGDIPGDKAQLWINGVAGTATMGDLGTGKFSNETLYYFTRGGATLPFTGREYSSIVRFSTTPSTEKELRDIERWTNQRTKSY